MGSKVNSSMAHPGTASGTVFFTLHVYATSTTRECLMACQHPELRETFARYGLPEQLISDNGPQFVSEELETFLRVNGNTYVLHHTTQPVMVQPSGWYRLSNKHLRLVVSYLSTFIRLTWLSAGACPSCYRTQDQSPYTNTTCFN